jgi:hypothetical protein
LAQEETNSEKISIRPGYSGRLTSLRKICGAR